MRNTLVTISRTVIFFVMASAGLGKLTAMPEFVDSLGDWNILPAGYSNLVALLIVWIEVGLLAWLVSGPRRRTASLAISLLFFAFAVAVFIESRMRGDLTCNCFGAVLALERWRSSVPLWIGSNIALAAIALVGALPVALSRRSA